MREKKRTRQGASKKKPGSSRAGPMLSGLGRAVDRAGWAGPPNATASVNMDIFVVLWRMGLVEG